MITRLVPNHFSKNITLSRPTRHIPPHFHLVTSLNNIGYILYSSGPVSTTGNPKFYFKKKVTCIHFTFFNNLHSGSARRNTPFLFDKLYLMWCKLDCSFKTLKSTYKPLSRTSILKLSVVMSLYSVFSFLVSPNSYLSRLTLFFDSQSLFFES